MSAYDALRTSRRFKYARPMAVHPQIHRLADMLNEMAALCAKHGNGWATPLLKWRQALLQSDAWGLHELLKTFRGMGSLNDVILQSVEQDMRADNEQFQALLGDAWQLAHDLEQAASGI